MAITNAHDAWTSVATFQISVSDNCPGTAPAVTTPVSGSAFPLGTNPVSCVVTDAAGNVATCSFKVIVQPGNQAPVPVIKVAPLAHFAGWTNLIIIAPRGVEACVRLTGRRSFDPEGDVFSYAWWEGTNFISTNVTARVRLSLGAHDITLMLDDHLPLGTNQETVTLEIITPADAVAILIGQLEESGFAANRVKPLMASLNAAYAAFRRGNFKAGANQLRAFERKLFNHDAPDFATAEALIYSAEKILTATESEEESDCREHDSDRGHDGNHDDDRDDDNDN
jgi:hypothetical protein